MELNPTATATQIRHQQWLADIRECNERPATMTVDEWCQQHGIKKNTYYCRMKALRKLCLRETMGLSAEQQQTAAAAPATFVELPQSISPPVKTAAITLAIGNARIEIPETISDGFLLRILEAASHA